MTKKDLLPYDYKVQVLPASLDTHGKLLICCDGCIVGLFDTLIICKLLHCKHDSSCASIEHIETVVK